MSRIFIGNFDFEHSLGTMPGRALTKAVRQVNAELASVWIAIAREGDIIETPEPPDEQFADDLIRQGFPPVRFVGPSSSSDRHHATPLEVCPWGWTESILKRARQNGWINTAPDISAVRVVNSRRFSAQLEREWSVGLPGAVTIDSIDALETTIGSVARDKDCWVLKAEFGMSGRERLLGRGWQLPEQTVHWARRRLASNERLFFEPWVDCIEEAGLQFSIPPDGSPVLEGITPLETSPTGQYRGNRFDAATSVRETWRDTVEIGRRVARRVQQAGYFGPLGVDAMRYRDAGGAVRLRPIQDVNARWTMGAVSLGFRRLLSPGECGFQLHVRPSAVGSVCSLREWYRQRERTIPEGLRLIRTSPFTVGGRPVKMLTLILIGQPQDFSAAERWSAEFLGLCGRREGEKRSDSRGDFGMLCVPRDQMAASDRPGDVEFKHL